MITQRQMPVPPGLLAQIMALPQSDPGIKNSNQGGWHSQVSWSVPLWFQETAQSIEQVTGLRIHSLWFNINGPGHSNRWHTHGQTMPNIGVWYIQTPPNSGAFELDTGSEILTIEPSPGLLITHPGGPRHRVLENLSTEPRVSVAFNFA